MSDTAIRQNLIVAAATMAGSRGTQPHEIQDWNQRILQNAVELHVLANDHSPIAKHLAMLDECKKFVGTVAGGAIQMSSKRIIFGFVTQVNDKNETGVETARTDITDNNPAARAMANELKGLAGHRVLLWVRKEPIGNTGKHVRVIAHYQDLGVDGTPDPARMELARNQARNDAAPKH